MDRRSFLGLSAAALASFTLDPERLLWRPGQRTFFLPTPRQLQVGDVVAWKSHQRTLFWGSWDGANDGLRFVLPDEVTPVTPGTRRPIGVLTQLNPLIVQLESHSFTRS